VPEFQHIYESTVALLRERLDAKDAPVPGFETVEVAPYCFIGMPRSLVLGLPSDRLFLASVYFKMRDRELEAAELERLEASLLSGSTTREQILADLETDDKGRPQAVRTEWV
jgi:hypothetical protein